MGSPSARTVAIATVRLPRLGDKSVAEVVLLGQTTYPTHG